MVAGDEAGQRLHPAILVQRVDLGIGTLIRDVFLDEQMAVCQRSDLGRVGDAEDLMTLGTLAQHLTDAAGRLAGNAAVDLVVDVKIGDALRTVTKEITVVDEGDRRESKSRNNPSVGVGIGIGWGSGWHHGGGIGIGVGPWW